MKLTAIPAERNNFGAAGDATGQPGHFRNDNVELLTDVPANRTS